MTSAGKERKRNANASIIITTHNSDALRLDLRAFYYMFASFNYNVYGSSNNNVFQRLRNFFSVFRVDLYQVNGETNAATTVELSFPPPNTITSRGHEIAAILFLPSI